jgi:dinuclear metal center YbgI/SA1388 family protein
MKLKEIISAFESFAPVAFQEDYDNSGLTVGDPDMEISAVLLCIDITLEVIEEALRKGANLVISHHPVLFKPLSKITGKTATEKILLLSIRQNIALFCAHTNLDNILQGVNHKICLKLGIQKPEILRPQKDSLKKLVTYVPVKYADAVRQALFEAGAGHIGNYDACSFNVNGEGTFCAQEGAVPFIGEMGKLHTEKETRIETIFPAIFKPQIIQALLKVHPYEEAAYDIFPIDNTFRQVGSGIIGELSTPEDENDFLNQVKATFGCTMLRHSQLLNRPVKRIAVCGGSGAFLIPAAISAGADVFLTGEIKYHQFFDAENRIVVTDIGHYESEQFTIEIFYDILIKKIPNFAIHFSSIKTSPIYYL